MSDEIRSRLWIHNQWEDAASGETFPTLNPATGEEIAQIARADAADVDRAVASAKQAFHSPEWSRMDPHARSRLLWKLADLIEANADEFGRLETMDNGKPYFESRRIDVPSAVGQFRYFAGMADKIMGEVIPVPGPFLNYTLREPVGSWGASPRGTSRSTSSAGSWPRRSPAETQSS